MRILIAAVAVAMLAGCASSAISVRDAKPVPSDEVYAFQTKTGQVKAGRSRLCATPVLLVQAAISSSM